MNIIYLESSQDSLEWFYKYYSSVFPEGSENAYEHYKIIESLLSENPYIGKLTGDEDARKLKIPNTPFSYIYRIKNEYIEILTVWDDRQNKR